jgi:uncharacterized membrane protein YccC
MCERHLLPVLPLALPRYRLMPGFRRVGVVANAKDALPFALTRIAANLVGSAAIVLCLLGGLPSVVTLALAYGLAITACSLLHLMNASRTALAAVTIILLHPTEAHLWDNALERVLSVVAGCIVALVVTLAFHRRWSEPSKDAPGDHAQ